MIWFIADTHFGHANIIKFTDRPYGSVGEMNESLIENWNNVVDHDDVVYHLGDFTLGNTDDARGYFSRLNGRIRVLGYSWHHDSRWLPNEDGESDFYSASDVPIVILPPVYVFGVAEYGTETHKQYIVLSHYPFAVWDRKHYGAWHLHGHTHGNYSGDGFVMDVGVDAIGCLPINLIGVADHMRALGWHPGWLQFGDKDE